jgi:two-component system response regulator NreC
MASHDRSAAGPIASPSRGVRIVLADDHQVLRGGLRLILDAEPDFEVVGEAGDVESARRCLRREHPDILVLDLNMPGGSALKAIPDLRAAAPATQIVVLTMQSESSYVREARRGGARGYVLKEQAAGDLVDAVRTVMAGGVYVSRVAASRMSADRIRSGAWD